MSGNATPATRTFVINNNKIDAVKRTEYPISFVLDSAPKGTSHEEARKALEIFDGNIIYATLYLTENDKLCPDPQDTK